MNAGFFLYCNMTMTQRVTIRNDAVRTDLQGNPIDCHDGCLRYFNGRFYHYGTRYGNTDGFGFTNRYVVYSSPELVNWTNHGELLDGTQAPGVYYRPYVVFNPSTKKYVLWFNWYPELWKGRFATAESDSQQGPFKVVHDKVDLCRATPGDHNVFVDEDATAYLIYTDITGDTDRHAMSVERLSDDYLTSRKEGSATLDNLVEAPAMFKRNGMYYAVFGKTCCFCPEGSDARVFIADKPLGPWRLLCEINCDDEQRIIIPGQQTDIATIPTANGNTLLWMCDLWGSRADAIKGHDLQFGSEPLRFNSDGTIQPLRWCDRFELDIASDG
jgi:hypothetical protein